LSAHTAANATMRERLIGRLRALMARTVANGCTADEELVAARMVAKAIAQVDALAGNPPDSAEPAPLWAKQERDSAEYQAVLEKNTAEAMLKAAVLELSVAHVNLVSPPRPRRSGQPVQRVGIHDLLEPHLGMVLAVGGTRMGRQLLRQTIDELVYEGALPPSVDMPLGR
jgi:hypothetical protein